MLVFSTRGGGTLTIDTDRLIALTMWTILWYWAGKNSGKKEA